MDEMAPALIRYDPALALPANDLRIEVIGIDQPFTGMYDVPRGIPAVRVTQFHHAVEVVVGDHRMEVNPDTVVVQPPDTPVCYGRSDGVSWRHSWLRLAGVAVKPLLRRCGVPLGVPVPMQSAQAWAVWSARLQAEMSHALGPDRLAVEGILTAWLREIGRRATSIEPAPLPEPLRRAREYVEAHFLEPLTLADVAAAAHRSPRHLCSSFKRCFGAGPVEYAIRLRLDHAADLLRETDWPVGTVALRSGFRDVYYFSRMFRRIRGSTPTAWRNAGASAR